jgi:hypothetical protein
MQIMVTKTATSPPVRVDEEFRIAAESVLHEGQSLTGFIETAMQRAVEHRRTGIAFEAKARKSLARYKRTGAAKSVDEVFDSLQAKVDARRKQALGK